MDESKLHSLADERGYGELVTITAVPSKKWINVLLGSLVLPVGVAVAGFVSGRTLVGILGIVGIPVVYFVSVRVIARLTETERAVLYFREGVIVVAGKADPTAYGWSELRLTKREVSPGYTELDIDTQAGQRVITINSDVHPHQITLVEMTAEASAR